MEFGNTEVGLVLAQQDLCSLSLEMVIKSCLVWPDQVSYLTLHCVLFTALALPRCAGIFDTYTLKESDALVQTYACIAYNQKKKNPTC